MSKRISRRSLWFWKLSRCGYVRVLRPGTAMRCLYMILESEPENVEALVIAGKIIQQGGGESDEAVKHYRRALELDPERDDARLHLAQILLREYADEARALTSST